MKRNEHIFWICMIVITSVLAFLMETAEGQGSPNGAACKINNENWCGSGSLAGPSLVLTNIHVAKEVGDRMQLTFIVDGRERSYSGTCIAGSYSRRGTTDWAIVETDTDPQADGVPLVRLYKENPVGSSFTFTGSPRCQFPVTTAVTLVGGAPDGVVFWKPVTIGGQSGSSLWSTFEDNQRVASILLTWSWGGNGAGQPTSTIWGNIRTKTNASPDRPEGLMILDPIMPEPKEGYFEVATRKATFVQELDIWYEKTDPTDPDPEPGNLTAKDIAAAQSIKGMGFDLASVETWLNGLRSPMGNKAIRKSLPITGPRLQWEEPLHLILGQPLEGQKHTSNGETRVLTLTTECIGDQCIETWLWIPEPVK